MLLQEKVVDVAENIMEALVDQVEVELVQMVHVEFVVQDLQHNLLNLVILELMALEVLVDKEELILLMVLVLVVVELAVQVLEVLLKEQEQVVLVKQVILQEAV